MITFPNAPTWLSLGWIIALLILILAIVFMAIGRMDFIVGGMFAGLAIARLL